MIPDLKFDPAIRLPRIANFLTWWVRCDQYLAAMGEAGAEHNEAATLFRQGLDADVAAGELKSLRADARALREMTT